MTYGRFQSLSGTGIALVCLAHIVWATNGGICNTRISYRSDTVPPYVHAPVLACEKNQCPNPCGVAGLSIGGNAGYVTCVCPILQPDGSMGQAVGPCSLAYRYQVVEGGGQLDFECLNDDLCPAEEECSGDHTGSTPLDPGPGTDYVYGCTCK